MSILFISAPHPHTLQHQDCTMPEDGRPSSSCYLGTYFVFLGEVVHYGVKALRVDRCQRRYEYARKISVRLTICICRLTSGSVSAFLHISKNSSSLTARSGSDHRRRMFALDTGSMILPYFSRRTSLYRSRILSSARPLWMPYRQSYRLPTSTRPPVKPSPPLQLR